MGWNVFNVLSERSSKAFSINQLIIPFSIQCGRHGVFDKLAWVAIIKDDLVKILLKVSRHVCPISANRFQPFKDHFRLLIFNNHTGIALFTARFRTTNGRAYRTFKAPFHPSDEVAYPKLLLIFIA
ncbi:hypothetical protein A3743_26505 [Oleiphilus sp. HI0072]|nr:hypothetical protein A3743_26505 [Oleiphilus sp. HI0072]